MSSQIKHVQTKIATRWEWLSTWRIIPVSRWLITTIYKPFRPFIRGITRSLGDLRSPWLLTSYKSWDDPPSTNQIVGFITLLKLNIPKTIQGSRIVWTNHHGFQGQNVTLHKTNSSHLKMDGWKTSFLLGWHIFRCELLVSGRVNFGVIAQTTFFSFCWFSLYVWWGHSSFDATGKVRAIEAGIPSLKLAAASWK